MKMVNQKLQFMERIIMDKEKEKLSKENFLFVKEDTITKSMVQCLTQ